MFFVFCFICMFRFYRTFIFRVLSPKGFAWALGRLNELIVSRCQRQWMLTLLKCAVCVWPSETLGRLGLMGQCKFVPFLFIYFDTHCLPYRYVVPLNPWPAYRQAHRSPKANYPQRKYAPQRNTHPVCNELSVRDAGLGRLEIHKGVKQTNIYLYIYRGLVFQKFWHISTFIPPPPKKKRYF